MACRVALGMSIIAFMVPVTAMAQTTTGQGHVAWSRFIASDHCAQNAYKANPEYTAEAIAKRNAQWQQCLAAGNLPPRELPPPSQQ
jgi:hypothetical protein